MEITISAKTVKLAVELGAKQLGKDVSEVTYTVIEEPKKGFLGMGASEAKVIVSFSESITPEKLTLDFLNTLIQNMGIEAEAKIVKTDEKASEKRKDTIDREIYVNIEGEGLGMLIGRHGDVLDAIQYLSNIAAGRFPRDPDQHVSVKVMIDIENYREKREETLKILARRMAQKALSYRRNLTLEPMSSYERRIIHSEIQEIDGVHTYSIGSESDRRIVIALGNEEKKADKPLGAEEDN
jgi:Predicted RNA-binding protein